VAQPITNITWQVTDQCNLACSCCYLPVRCRAPTFPAASEIVRWFLCDGSGASSQVEYEWRVFGVHCSETGDTKWKFQVMSQAFAECDLSFMSEVL